MKDVLSHFQKVQKPHSMPTETMADEHRWNPSHLQISMLNSTYQH